MVKVEYVAVADRPLLQRFDAYQALALNINPKLLGRDVKSVDHHEVICGLERGLENARVFLSAQITYND